VRSSSSATGATSWRAKSLHPRSIDGARFTHGQRLPALRADPALVDYPAAFALVDHEHGGPVRQRLVLVTPEHQRRHHRPEVEPLLRQEVLVALGPLAVRTPLDDVLVDQPLEASREDIPGDPEGPLHLRELPPAMEDLPDQQQRPSLADQLEASRDGADLAFVFVAEHHCDVRTLSCVMQLTVLGSRSL
jgi:hypothetical protein